MSDIIRAEVTEDGQLWAALLVPLTSIRVDVDGVHVPAEWDRQTISGTSMRDVPRAFTLAMRAAIAASETP